MTLHELLQELETRQLRVRLEGDNLRIAGAGLDAGLADHVRAHKPALIELLRTATAAPSLSATSNLERDPHPFAPFPLTDIQQAYWIGRGESVPWGRVSTHYYGEFDCEELDLPRLEASLNQLIARHAMLRAIITPDARQQVLPEVPRYSVIQQELRGRAAATANDCLMAWREEMSHQVLAADRFPLFDVRASWLDSGRCRLHISVDLLIADFAGLMRLAHDWRRLYDGESLPPPRGSFREYVLAQQTAQQGAAWERARTFWRNRADQLPPSPPLPALRASNTGPARFRRIAGALDPAEWRSFKQHARACGVSASIGLLAAFSEVLAQWSNTSRFTLTLTHVDAVDAQTNGVVGDFTKATLTEIDRQETRTFAERASALQQRVLTDMGHSDYSALRVARDLMRSDPSRAFFPIVFTSALPLTSRASDSRPLGFEAFGKEVFSISQTPQVWLDHVCLERHGGLVFRWDLREGVFAEGLVEDMAVAYRRLLQQLCQNQAAWGTRLHASPAAEDLEQRNAANETRWDHTEPTLLHELFQRSVRRDPDAVAVCTDEAQYSYRDLAERANAVAHALVAAHVLPGTLIAVVAEDRFEQIVAILGILMAGSAYLPVSMSWPPERIREVLRIARASVAVAGSGTDTGDRVPEETFVLRMRSGAREPRPVPQPTLAASALAYVIFTSGSTGQPKGVMIEHHSVVNVVADLNQRFEITTKDRLLGISEISFDLSVYDLFGAFAAGAAVVLLADDNHGRRNPAYWRRAIQQHGVSVWNSVPAFMSMLLQHYHDVPGAELNSLRLVMLSGDWIPMPLVRQIVELLPAARAYSLGGATEASIWSILYPITSAITGLPSVPYGFPLRNQQLFVLDEHLRPSPRLVEGDLYIGGVGLARGYWQRPDLTAPSFFHHEPFGVRLYRTGDRGRYRCDGSIEFLGRKDGQIKIHGFRVELEEIEAKLCALPEVTAAVACILRKDQSPQLAAAIAVTGRTDTDHVPQLRAALAKQLPDYMVPSRWLLLEALPLSANGKVDRAAARDQLEKQLEAPPSPAVFMAATELETTILEVLQEITGVAHSDVSANFFELGATSLDLVRVHGRLAERIGATIEATALFEHSSVRRLAQHVAMRTGPQAPDDTGASSLAGDRRRLLRKRRERAAAGGGFSD
jgi:pyochelin synthetase